MSNKHQKFIDTLTKAFNELLSRLEIPDIESGIIENMFPKSILILLPLVQMYNYRQWRHGILRFPIFWQMLILSYIYKNKGKKRLRTMEINLQKTDVKTLSEEEINDLNGAVCLVASVQSYMTALEPLARSLHENGFKVCLLIPQEGLEWRAVKGLIGVIKVVEIESFMTPEIRDGYVKNRKKAVIGWEKIKPLDFFITDLSPLRDMMEIMPDQVKYVAAEIIPQTDAFMKCAANAIKFLKPKAIFAARLKRITENVFCRAAKADGIPVYMLNHGHFGQDWFPLSIGNVITGVDKVIVWGENQRQSIINLFPGLSQDKIFSAGGIQWDRHIRKYCGSDKPDIIELRRKISSILAQNGSSIDQTIPWITITMDEGMRRMLPTFFEAVDGLNGFHLFIKIRSDESIEDYSRFVNNTTFPVTIITWDMDISLHEILYSSLLAITFASTSNIDGLCTGTPVLTLMLDKESQRADRYVYLEEYGLPVVTTRLELRSIIAEIIKPAFDPFKLKAAAGIAAENILANYPNCDAGLKIINLLMR
ncbi:MAG: hypothetical protein HQK91_09560 [Nitrospirae bacterium]|nr:hypothetical protein [Nitrospirota bacterium]